MKRRLISLALVTAIVLGLFPSRLLSATVEATTYDLLFPVQGGELAYYYGYSAGYSGFHTGIDIHSNGNDIIYAAASGTVVNTANSCWHVDTYPTKCEHYSTYGNYIKIRNDDGTYSYYGHLKQNTLCVAVGDRVTRGQEIATMGSSGYSSGKHLHYEMRLSDGNTKINVNPTSADGSVVYATSGYAAHTHIYNEFVYYWSAHPHYKCYQCGCGKVKENTDEPTYVDECQQCIATNMPGKPTLSEPISAEFCEEEEITFSWNATSNTTHYNLYIQCKDTDDQWQKYDHLFEVNSGVKLTLPVGEYRCLVQAYNSQYWNADHSDWLYTESDYTYVTVFSSSDEPEDENHPGVAGTYGAINYTIENGVLTIGGLAEMKDYDEAPWEEHCSDVTDLVILNGILSIGAEAFRGWSNLKTVTIAGSVKVIGTDAFSECSALTDVYYGGTQAMWDALDNNNEEAFHNVTIHFRNEGEEDTPIVLKGTCGDNLNWELESIGDEIFSAIYLKISGAGPMYDYTAASPAPWSAVAFDFITLDDGITSIGAYAFAEASLLEIPTFPSTVKSIGQYAFYNVDASYVTIAEGVEVVGDYAFCNGNTYEINLPSTIVTIGASAFTNSEQITIYYNGAQEQWNAISIGSDNMSLINATIHFAVAEATDYEYSVENDEATITGYTGNGGDITVPSTLGGYPVATIGTEAFADCSSLTSVIIPDSVTTIDVFSFNNCTGLTNVTIPGSVISIGDCAFQSCTSLASVTIPDSVESIDFAVFNNCASLTSVTLPDSVKSIGARAFSFCTVLTSITISDSVTSIGEGAFYECTSLTDMYYGGTQEQWNAISIGNYNDPLRNANIYFLVNGASNGEETFATLQEALDTYENGTIQLLADADSVTVTKNVVVDLNGFDIASVTVTAGELTVLDSKTDDYSVADNDYGKIAAISGTVKSADGYIAITEADGTSCHRAILEITDMVLRSEDAGIYYNCSFSGDELVAAQVTTYGVALSVKGAPEIGLRGTAYSVFDQFATGANTPSTLLKSVLKETNTSAQNNRNANLQVYGRAYIQIGDTYIYGETVSRSFREQVELVDTIWSTLTTEQKTAVQTMYRTFQSDMTAWTIPNIKANV